MKGKKLIKVLSAVLASALLLTSCGKAEEASVSSETWISAGSELAEEAVDEQALEEAKKIYELSAKMRAYEYLDNNVIRIWNDEIMKAGLNATATTLLLQ